MIKKILISIFALFSFFLMFLLGFDKINILAMGSFENSIGSIPIQMDINNYDNINLYDNNYTECGYSYITNCSLRDNNIYIDVEAITPNGYTIITKDIRSLLDTGVEYTFTLFTENDNDYFWFRLFNSNNTDYQGASSFNKIITYTFNDNMPLYLAVYTSNQTRSYTINGVMITKGAERPTYYSSMFKFGYNASLIYSINTNTSTTVNYYFNDNIYTKTSSSITSGYLIENYYLPFNIDSRGYMSFPNISFGISSITNNDNNITYTLQLELTPIFNAYYKGSFTSNIYSKMNYMSNDLFFSGVSFSGCKSTSCINSINSSNLSLINSKILDVTELNDTGGNSTINISTYYNDEIKNRNYFEFNNYLNVGFKIGYIAENYNRMNGVNFTFGISSLSSRIIDSETTTTPLPDNELTNDKYNTCSAWYDIPCQLSNGLTYVIYEAPIISPVLTFVVSFVTMFSSLVTFIDLFKSFGVVFGCIIIYMFIELLHKYSK